MWKGNAEAECDCSNCHKRPSGSIDVPHCNIVRVNIFSEKKTVAKEGGEEGHLRISDVKHPPKRTGSKPKILTMGI
jgi:hypothetical protein